MRYGDECDISEVLFSYYLKEYDTDKGIYHLIMRVGRVSIITFLRTNDCNWNDRFFFVKEDLGYRPQGLGDAPSYWKATSKT